MNSPGQQPEFFGVKVSKPGINVNSAGDQQLVYKDDYSTKTYYDNTNIRMLEGKLPDGTYGLRVSLPGYDATSNHLLFNSSQIAGVEDCPPVALSPSGSQVYQFTIPHNLGFVPSFHVIALVPNDNSIHFALFPPTYYVPAYDGMLYKSNSITYIYVMGVDTTNLYLELSLGNTDGTNSHTSIDVKLQYYIDQIQAI